MLHRTLLNRYALIYELVQNAEDNQYSYMTNNDIPYLRFCVYPLSLVLGARHTFHHNHAKTLKPVMSARLPRLSRVILFILILFPPINRLHYHQPYSVRASAYGTHHTAVQPVLGSLRGPNILS